jgi:predicted  nucleic acid-binding Zn-ribbon protein
MTTVTESDIKDLKDLIVAFREDVNTRMSAIETRVAVIETRLSAIETRLSAIETRLTVIETRLDTWKPSIDKIPDLAEKVGELKNWRQIAFIAITATTGALVGWFARGGSPRP